MADDRKPMPDLDDPFVAAFFAATQQRRLVVQQCAQCRFLRWPPGPLCPRCQAAGGEWTDVRPTGSLYSYAVYHRPLNPGFADDVPYAVGLIELDDGPRMYGRLIGDYDASSVGCRMHAQFVPASPEVTFVHWARG